eukprot:PhF_6_TR36544/c3_g1_i2/m.53899
MIDVEPTMSTTHNRRALTLLDPNKVSRPRDDPDAVSDAKRRKGVLPPGIVSCVKEGGGNNTSSGYSSHNGGSSSGRPGQSLYSYGYGGSGGWGGGGFGGGGGEDPNQRRPTSFTVHSHNVSSSPSRPGTPTSSKHGSNFNSDPLTLSSVLMQVRREMEPKAYTTTVGAHHHHLGGGAGASYTGSPLASTHRRDTDRHDAVSNNSSMDTIGSVISSNPTPTASPKSSRPVGGSYIGSQQQQHQFSNSTP